MSGSEAECPNEIKTLSKYSLFRTSVSYPQWFADLSRKALALGVQVRRHREADVLRKVSGWTFCFQAEMRVSDDCIIFVRLVDRQRTADVGDDGARAVA